MKTIMQARASKALQISLPFAAPLVALGTMLIVAAGSTVAMMMIG